MGVIQKAGNFLGIKKFADAMATTGRVLSGSVAKDLETQKNADNSMMKITYAIRNEKDPAKKAQLAKLAQSLLNNKQSSAEQIDPGLNLSTKEILGSAANVALNVAMPGALKGSKGAIVAKNAVLGSGFGAASGLEKNRNTSGIVGSTVGGALTGAAIGTGGILASKVKDVVSKSMTGSAEWLMNNAVRPAIQDLKKNVKFGTDTLGKQLLDEGVSGGPKKLLEISDKKQNELEDSLEFILKSYDDAFDKDLLNRRMNIKALPEPSFIPLGEAKQANSKIQILEANKTSGRNMETGRFKRVYDSSGKVISEREIPITSKPNLNEKVFSSYQEERGLIKKQSITSYLKDLVLTKSKTPGSSGDINKIKQIMSDLPDEMTLMEANEIKKNIYNELRDVSYKLDPKLGVKAAALKQIARGLKTEIENTVGGTVVKDINQKLSIYGRLENNVTDQIVRGMRNNGIGLTDAILAAGGAATQNPLAFLGAIGVGVIRHNKTGIETLGAKGINKLGNSVEKIGTGLVGKGTKEIIRRTGFNLP